MVICQDIAQNLWSLKNHSQSLWYKLSEIISGIGIFCLISEKLIKLLCKLSENICIRIESLFVDNIFKLAIVLAYALHRSVTSRSNKWRWDYFFCRISVRSKDEIHWVNFCLEKNYLCIKLLNFGRCSLVDSLFLYVIALIFYISCSKIQTLRWITIENRYL